jgi:uncharacterized RDD family membrane protein YckC
MKSNNLQGQYSGFLSRIFGFMVDVFILIVINLVLYLLVYALLMRFTDFELNACPTQDTFSLRVMTCQITSWGFNAYLALFPVLYFLFFWTLTGQTLGDYAAGVRVVRTDGRRVGLISGLLRCFGYLFCFLTLGLGFLWILVDNRRQGWHDKLAGTCMIYAWEARQNEVLLQKISQRLFGRTQNS